MLVMLSLGLRTNEVIEKLSKQIDNVDFHYLSNVYEFINQSRLRRFAFDRLIFSTKFVSSDEEMSKLCDYVREDLSSVEIVFILNNNSKELEEVFKKYFDSPMYSVVYINNPTLKSFKDSVKLSISELKALYYDNDEDDSKDGKRGFLGMFKGGRRNIRKSEINEKSKDDSSKTAVITSDSTENNSWDSEFKSILDSNENSSESNLNDILSQHDDSKKSENSGDATVSHANSEENDENSEVSTDDLDLSIGEYGSQHSDSGFLDDSEIEELNSLSNNDNTQSEAVKSNDNTHSEAVKSGVTEEDDDANSKVADNKFNSDVDNTFLDGDDMGGTSSVDSHISNYKDSSLINLLIYGKMNIVTGLSGSGATAFIVNSAMSEVERGFKVLIIDVDYKSNGILSFIDIDKFYDTKRYCGSNGARIYSEDGIDIISNGYGCTKELDLPTLTGYLSNYDLVLVDCPIECLSSIPDDIFVKGNVVLCTISDISKLMELTLIISDRKIVSLKKEVKINRECKVANSAIDNDDIDFVKGKVLFPNGCFLDNM